MDEEHPLSYADLFGGIVGRMVKLQREAADLGFDIRDDGQILRNGRPSSWRELLIAMAADANRPPPETVRVQIIPDEEP